MHLIVTNAFGEHARGDAIIDPDEIETVLASEHADCVVAVNPAPEPPKE